MATTSSGRAALQAILDMSIGNKLTAIAMLTTTAALLVASGVFVARDLVSLRHALLERAGVEAEMVGRTAGAALSFQDARGAEEVLSVLSAIPNIDAAWALTGSDQVLSTYQRHDPPLPLTTLGAWDQPGQAFVGDHITAMRPVRVDGETVGSVVVQANLTELQQRYRSYAGLVLLVLLASSVVALVLLRRLQRFVTAPIHELTTTAQAVSARRDYSLRAHTRSADELGVLVGVFNQMLGEIQARDQALSEHRDQLEEKVQARTHELVEVNDQLRLARDRAQAANRAKSTFLANMSHEIRTPMTAILGYADLLAERRQSPAEQLQHVKVIRRNASHLLELINDVLDLSKIEADQMTVERVPTDLLLICTEVASLARPRASEQDLGFFLDYEDPVPRVVLTDPLRLRQVLVNLVDNAIKFTSSGSVGLSVSCPNLEQDQDLRVRFEVSDTGIGMSEDQLDRIFKPFSQGDESMTRRFGGTGLGLAISKRIALALDGDLTVQSTAGKGSVFTLEIDAGSQARGTLVSGVNEALLEAILEPDRRSSKHIRLDARILLAEDGPDNQRLISTHLQRAGARVVVANHGQEALEWASSERFDLVLMDMQMPVLDGYATTRRLREEGCELPIIALTAHAMSDDRDRCIEAGCTHYLSKPIARDTLLRAIAQHLPPDKVGTLEDPSSPTRSEEAGRPERRGHVVDSDYASDPEMQDLIKLFVDKLPSEVRALLDQLEADQYEEVLRTCHQLKGAGGGYGFQAITRLAGDVVRSLRTEADLQQVRSEVHTLVAHIRSVRGYRREDETDPWCHVVLAIDDSPEIHSLLEVQLKHEPVELHSALDGEAGLALAQSLRPDLILLDVSMPSPDGFEVCRRLKLDNRVARVPVIFLTGASGSDEKIKGLELGAVDYITKPFEPAELRARIRAALRMQQLMSMLSERAQIDALTGLWNRGYFDQRFALELESSQQSGQALGLLMLDLDHFKEINDTYGHPFGDVVLRKLSALLQANVREEDTVCRYGGEEFAIIAPNTRDAVGLAERLRTAVRSMSLMLEGQEMRVSVSIGVATAVHPTHALVSQADAALYSAKHAGRDRVVASHQHEVRS